MGNPPKVEMMPADKQARLDRLLNEKSEGMISPEDEAALEQLVAEAEQLMVENAKRLASFAEDESPAAPSSAVPVTVWVKPPSSTN
ncbi:hypothetical protein FYK55_25755 [Roseiconus nitratireducens]|uniref:Uncharacterized protein n=1 Tax=Roseiconus nitratireducens TaxID=2605748 RepID=A0A5M6CUW2_9BACT|nr:hypothetical protein [Roseiconus nitratireducens]KAA5539004.1 hypothetical protein FYK55_25755 [Roseiconus nitratireducens]